MSSFDICYPEVEKHEGGYVNDPLDSGGETYKGISRRWFPKSDIWELVDKIKQYHPNDYVEYINNSNELRDRAKAFYKKYFWDEMRLDEVYDWRKALVIFSTGVNAGKRKATTQAQLVAGALVDGVIGPNTLRAINEKETEAFVYHYLMEVVEFYNYIVKKKPDQRRFFFGWINRALSMYYKVSKVG